MWWDLETLGLALGFTYEGIKKLRSDQEARRNEGFEEAVHRI